MTLLKRAVNTSAKRTGKNSKYSTFVTVYWRRLKSDWKIRLLYPESEVPRLQNLVRLKLQKESVIIQHKYQHYNYQNHINPIDRNCIFLLIITILIGSGSCAYGCCPLWVLLSPHKTSLTASNTQRTPYPISYVFYRGLFWLTDSEVPSFQCRPNSPPYYCIMSWWADPMDIFDEICSNDIMMQPLSDAADYL